MKLEFDDDNLDELPGLIGEHESQLIPTTKTLTKEDRALRQDSKTSQAEVRDQGTSHSTTQPEALNQTELAKRFKMSRNLVIQLIEEAGIEPISRGGPAGTRYRLTQQLEEVLVHKYLKSDRKLEATERKLEAEAELKEIEVQRRRGELISTSEVELGGVQLFRALYTRLVQYCDDTAIDISALRTRGEVAAYQKIHLGKLLQELRTDPNNFITKYLPQEPNEIL